MIASALTCLLRRRPIEIAQVVVACGCGLATRAQTPPVAGVRYSDYKNNTRDNNEHVTKRPRMFASNKNKRGSANDRASDERGFAFGGRSAEFASDGTADEQCRDPEDLLAYDRALDQFATNKKAYDAKAESDDERQRRRVRLAIQRKRIAKLEQRQEPQQPNLLTWDAKEQIKHLHLQDPSE